MQSYWLHFLLMQIFIEKYVYLNMEKKIIRLTESDLHNIIRDSVYRILEENANVNEGWKNWAMAGALGAASIFGGPQTANAQNYFFNSIKDPSEVTGQKIDDLLLDANRPISYNYDLIRQRMCLHREKKYAEYIICCKGRYTNKKGQTCINVTIPNGMIHIKGKDNEEFRTIDGQIIHALTNLYAQSLDDKFDVSPDELQSFHGHDYRIVDEPIITIRTNNGISGGLYRKEKAPKHLVYNLSEYSPTWKKIYNKVIEETGLKDGGTMYDMDYKLGHVDGKNRLFDDGTPTSAEEMPQFPEGTSALYEYLSIQTRNNYPIIARENDVQGCVDVSFVVEKDGSITDVKVVRSVDPSLDAAAKKIIQRMPRWVPAKQNGSAVRCKYNVPVKFILDN